MKKTTEAVGRGLFDTNKRIKLGIWGLGRGLSFASTCASVNIDVVAGCDFNEILRQNFLKANPGAFVTARADEFLKQDFDAVLLATYCPAHAEGAIRCLRAGKHVLSEVTAFHTMGEGVRLVEEVEKSGLVYNLAENYPFNCLYRYLARKWKEGLFGELEYAEFEYLHEGLAMHYSFNDGQPVQPGNTVHSWRSWLNYHYYCTHSLGPVMIITGTRPKRVVAFPCRRPLPGQPTSEGLGGIAPSLIEMDNGGLVRNLMGSTTNDSHVQRLWGTRGSAEIGLSEKWLQLRLGASGHSPKMEVRPPLDALDKLAAQSGHGGGDFWMPYFFARQILTGEKAPFDIYAAADVTIPGILAFWSARENGKAYDVPDFREPRDRAKYRRDNRAQKRFNVAKGCFPPHADYRLTQHFSKTMVDLIGQVNACRAYADWKKVADETPDRKAIAALGANLVCGYPQMRKTYAMARKLADAYPKSDGARVLREMLELGDEPIVMAPGFLARLKREQSSKEIRL